VVIDSKLPRGNRLAMSGAQNIIATLDLSPHPEGGWFRETWRAPCAQGQRPASTAILFLLAANERSHWHKVDADEIWIWQSGDPLAVHISRDDTSEPATSILGDDLASQSLQAVVPAHQWQAAEPLPGANGYTLVSCIVAPGFDFAGFQLAPPAWKPGA
jgi:uncharacterized protein